MSVAWLFKKVFNTLRDIIGELLTALTMLTWFSMTTNRYFFIKDAGRIVEINLFACSFAVVLCNKIHLSFVTNQ